MYKIKKETDKADIFIYSEIEYYGLTAKNIIDKLQSLPESIKTLNVHINSEGGDVFESIAIYNTIKNHPAQVNVFIEGLAASSASIIACAGKIHMFTGSLLMLHNPLTRIKGTSDTLRAEADILDKIRDEMTAIYVAKSGLDSEKVKMLMDSNVYLPANEAHDLGFCDEIIEAKIEAKADANDITSAIKAERTRIQELDDIKAPGYEREIYAAKYEAIRTARDVAYDIMKSGHMNSQPVLNALNAMNIDVSNTTQDRICTMINRRRGYKQ